MTSGSAASRAPAPTRGSVLVVDDDRRVRELLESALQAHGFAVTSVADGEEAIARTQRERPDLLVLDVRLPKRSGLEVCDALRGDPHEADLPILVVSALGEIDARLQAFGHGADDYLAKPFSPRELVARAQRLIARSRVQREARLRAQLLERELERSRAALERSDAVAARERRLRALARDLEPHPCASLDLEEAAGRMLRAMRAEAGHGAGALLAPGDGTLTPILVQGDRFARVADVRVGRHGPLSSLMRALGRPASVHSLLRAPEFAFEARSITAARFAWIVPVASAGELEALVLLDDRAGAEALGAASLEALEVLAETCGRTLAHARQVREGARATLAELGLRATLGASGRRETAVLVVQRAAATLALPPRLRETVVAACTLGAWAASRAGRALLARAALEPSGRIADVARILAGERPAAADEDARRAYALVAFGLDLAARLERNVSELEAARIALRALGDAADPELEHALAAAIPGLRLEDRR